MKKRGVCRQFSYSQTTPGRVLALRASGGKTARGRLTRMAAGFTALCLTVILATGCASVRSNTRTATSETFAVFYHPAQTKAGGPMHPMAALAAGALDIAVQAVIKVAAALIKQEGAKYEASSSHFLTIPFDTTPDPNNVLDTTLNSGGYLVILRIVDRQTDRQFGLTPLGQAQRQNLLSNIEDSVEEDFVAPPNYSELEQFVERSAKDTKHPALSFCAVLSLKPLISKSAFDVRLISFAYPGLKAKNARLALPFTSWSKTTSLLQIELETPQGFKARNGADFDATDVFAVAWPRKAPANYDQTKLLAPRNAATSRPAWVPRSKELCLTVTLQESSDMKAALEQLSTKVGGLKSSDVTSGLNLGSK